MIDYFQCEEKFKLAWYNMNIAVSELNMYSDKVQEYTPDDKIAKRYWDINNYFFRGIFEGIWHKDIIENKNQSDLNNYLIYCFIKYTNDKFLGYPHVSEDQQLQYGIDSFKATEEGLEFNKNLGRVVSGSHAIIAKYETANDENAINELKIQLDVFYKDQSIQFDSAVKSFFKNMFS